MGGPVVNDQERLGLRPDQWSIVRDVIRRRMDRGELEDQVEPDPDSVLARPIEVIAVEADEAWAIWAIEAKRFGIRDCANSGRISYAKAQAVLRKFFPEKTQRHAKRQFNPRGRFQ